MPEKEQINILSRKSLNIKDDTTNDKTKPKFVKTKIDQISVSNPKSKNEINKTIVQEKKPMTAKEITYRLTKFFTGMPTFFTKFLNSSGRAIYYSILGTMVSFIFAILLFPTNPGIFSVFFLTIFLAPFVIKEINLNVLLAGRTTKVENKGVSLTSIKVKENEQFSIEDFYEENKKILSIYFFFFIGIMAVVIALIVFMPINYSAQLFSQQGWSSILMPTKDIGFEDTNKLTVFFDIFKNNFSVMLVCFIVALVFPLGALLMIVWNAMYWAVAFTQYAVFYSHAYNVNLLFILMPLLLSVAMHTLIEAICYFFSSMAGNTLSIGIKKEKFDSDRFFYLLKYCLILLAFAAFFLILGSVIEVFVFDFLKNFFFSLF
ncbi:MAG: stage II sporulation protein M [archaeon]|jgi:uncharacterized membrane protein SpoIIM required for sporulation